ncbi:F-box protein [Citrus sinensis]|nr:F-box protein [Citrus sinensis]
MDHFDQLPDALILLIFSSVSDVKTLIRCRSVSKRFNSLVSQTESLSLRVDRVISPDSDSDSLFVTFLKVFLKSLQDLLTNTTSKPQTRPQQTQNSPAEILSQFLRIKNLQIELPGGDLNLDKGVTVKWRAEFGKSLTSCVIIGFKSGSTATEEDVDIAGGLKMRVMWTISSLIAAQVSEEEGWGGIRSRTRTRTMVPSVRMRMRHVPRLMLAGGIWVEGATLVVVRANAGGKDDVEDAELALGAFGDGSSREAVLEMLKSRSYMLEMNSF